MSAFAPCGYEEPLQDISGQLSEDNSQHPRSRRTFEEMDGPLSYNDDTNSETVIVDDEPLPKKHKEPMSLDIDIDFFIKATEEELVETTQTFRRIRKAGVEINADIQQFVLDRVIEPFTSGLLYTFLFALDCLIAENEGQTEKIEQEFDHVHEGRMLDDQSEVLDGHLLLDRQYKDLIETRRYILDFAPSDSSQALVQYNLGVVLYKAQKVATVKVIGQIPGNSHRLVNKLGHL